MSFTRRFFHKKNKQNELLDKLINILDRDSK